MIYLGFCMPDGWHGGYDGGTLGSTPFRELLTAKAMESNKRHKVATADELPTYLLLVLRGLEFLAEKEIREKLQVEHLELCSVQRDASRPSLNVMQGEAAVGRFLLKTRSPPEAIRQLQSVQAVLAFLAKNDEVITDSRDGVEQIAKLVMDSDWDAALSLWRSHLVQPVDKIAFRGSCVRDGRHKYKSVDIAGEIGALVVEKYGWEVDLDQFSLEVVCIVFENFMIAGISLADTSKIQFRSRLANEDRSIIEDSQYVSTLRPSTTYLMLQLAQYQDGDILLDSMCGVGTIPICCAAFTGNRIFALGGELDSLPVGKAGANAAARVTNTDISQWDSTRLPLRSKTIDKVIVDMPFGIRCGNHRINNKIYPKILRELLRVLRDDGRAVLLCMSKKLFKGCIKSLPAFRVVAEHEVNIGGLGGGIYVLEKA